MEFQVEIIKFIQQISCTFFDIFFEICTLFGEESIPVLLAAFIFLSIDKDKGYKVIFTIASGTCLNGLIKNIFKVERPIGIDGIISKRVETATGHSFPSGHTQAASTFWTSLSMIFKNKILYVATTIIIVLVAVSRLYLGVHWPTDVLFGAIFGISWAFIAGKVFDYIHKNKNYMMLMAISIIFTVIAFMIGDNDFHKAAGLLIGLSIGYIIETKYINFSIKMPKNKKIMIYIILIGGLLLIKGILKIIFPKIFIFSFIRYFIVGFWAFGITPIIAKKTI